MDAAEQPIPTPPAQRLADFRRRRLPLIVWTIAALACVWILGDRVRRMETIGLAQALQYEISATTTGRLDTVLVELFEDVRAGDLVAKLDDGALNAAIETARASLRQLDAQLEAARLANLASSGQERSSWRADLRRFQIDEEQRRLDALGLKVTIESDEIELERLALEVRRAAALFREGVIGEMQYDEVRLQHEETNRRIQENRVLLTETRGEYEAARQRRTAFERGLPQTADTEPLLRPLREALEVETRRLEEIRLARQGLSLRSPVDGQISQVLCRRGQSVVPGEPILTITERSAREIVAYLAEFDERSPAVGTPVRVAGTSRPERVVESYVLRVAESVEPLPPRLWRVAGRPDYGRAVVIAPVAGLELVPGERVGVRFGAR